MYKELFNCVLLGLLFASCSGVKPRISVVCEENKVGNCIVKWETIPALEGDVKVYVSTDPENIPEEEPVASAPIGKQWMTVVTDDPTKRYYFSLVFNDKYRVQTASRNVIIPGIQNFRDLGGYPSYETRKRLRWGMLYRSAKIEDPEECAVQELKNIGIKTIVDLRDEGEKDLTGFADGLGKLGAGVKSFYDEVVGIEKPETVKNAVAALKIFADIGYDGATGIANAMTSLMTLDWEGDMSNLGSGINTFSNSVVDIDITKIRTAITAVKELVAMIQSMDGIEGSVADGFITAFEKVSGVSTAEFLTNFGGSSEELKAAGQSIITFINSGVVAYKPVLIKTINDLLSELATNISSNNETFKTSGNDLINNFNTGFQTNLDVAKNAVNAMISDIVDSIRSFYQSFSNAGSYLVRGFANGISSNTYLATAKARTMASAADEAARMILGVRSPSTVGYEIGDYFGIGFVNGIDDNVKTVYKTSASMAEYARDGLTKALQKVSTILASDMDAEPTIRPVMDLSDISDGVASMNNMLSMSSSVGVLSNLGSISRSIHNNQNGINDDVVSAIRDLKRSLDDAPRGDNYNINGVTYDDGSNVSDAVQALIRAARIERRK